MTIGSAPECLDCIYFNEDKPGMTCKAYPEGIPEDIIMRAPHKKVRKDQKGDFVFKKKED